MFPHVCPALPVRHAAPSFILSLVLIKHLTQASDSLCNPGLPRAEVPGYTYGACNLTVTLTCLPSTWTGFLPADYLLPKDRELCVGTGSQRRQPLPPTSCVDGAFGSWLPEQALTLQTASYCCLKLSFHVCNVVIELLRLKAAWRMKGTESIKN